MRLRIWNFRSFAGEHVVDFPDKGLVFIRGRNDADPGMGANGAGKSSLLDAICWCLYGRTGAGARGPSLISSGCKSMAVEMEFGGHCIRRATGGGLLLDGQSTNQDALDRLLGADHAQFAACIYFHQRRASFVDWTPRQRSDWLCRLYDLDAWDVRAAHARDDAARWSADVAHLEADVARVEGRLQSLQDQDVSRAAADFESRKEARILELGNAINDLQSQLASVNEAVAECVAWLDVHPEPETGPVERQRDELAAERIVVRRALDRWARLGTECPVCEQPIDAAHAERHRAEYAQRLEDLDAEYARVSEQYDALRRELRAREEHLRKLEALRARRDGYVAQVRGMQQELHRVHAEENPYADAARRMERDRKQLEAELAQLRDALDRASREQMGAQFWARGFATLRNWALGVHTSWIGQASTSYARRLGYSAPVELSVSTDTTRQRVTGGIVITSGGELNRLSGGEYRRVSLAVDCAIADIYRRLCAPIGIEMWDEPMRYLSPDGLAAVLSVLRDRARDRLVLLADLAQTGEYVFDHVAEVVKTANGSGVLVHA